MIFVVRTAGDGCLFVRRSFPPKHYYSLTPEKGFALWHLRGGDGEYLATLERDRDIRKTILFNVYKGSERVGTMAAAARVGEGTRAFPVISFSWGGRRFDGTTLTEPVPWSETGKLRELAEIRKGMAGTYRVRMAQDTEEEDERDAMLALAVAAAWIRLGKRRRRR